MTVVIELETIEDWRSRAAHYDEKTFSFRKYGSRLKLHLNGYEKDNDVIYRINIQADKKIKDVSDEVKSKLDKESTYKGPVEYDLGPYGKFVNEEVIQDGRIKGHSAYRDDDNDKKLENKIKKKFKKHGFIEGKINGSATEIYVERE